MAMTADPTRRLSSIDLLDEPEHARLAVLGNRAGLTRPAVPAVSIPELFAEHVERTPQAVAVTCAGHSMTYRELDRRRIGWRTYWRPKEWTRVIVWRCCFRARPRRSWRSWPSSRPGRPTWRSTRRSRRRGCGSCSATPHRSAVLTTAELSERLDGSDLVVIDVNDPHIDTQPSTALAAPGPDNIAYLIYTSGTTGVPKGVAITHHNVTQLLAQLDAGLPAAGSLVAVSFVGLRRVGVGDLRRTSAGRAAGGGARIGGGLTRGLPRPAGC